MSASTTTTGRAAQAAAHVQEALMGQAVPTQHPAVVLRSHFNQLRALLAVALIAVIGLTVAVVILASTDQQLSDTSSAAPIGHLNYGEFNPATGRPQSAPLPRTQAQPASPATRPDGGPEESAVAATLSRKPTSVGHDESDTAAAVGSASKNSATGDYSRPPAPPSANRRDGGNRGPGTHTH
jgi:hypothetical protein